MSQAIVEKLECSEFRDSFFQTTAPNSNKNPINQVCKKTWTDPMKKSSYFSNLQLTEILGHLYNNHISLVCEIIVIDYPPWKLTYPHISPFKGTFEGGSSYFLQVGYPRFPVKGTLSKVPPRHCITRALEERRISLAHWRIIP